MSDERIIHEILREEIKRRLTVMDDPAYQFPRGLSFIDKVLIVVGIFGSLSVLAICTLGWLGE